jgi:hypothetical protein
MPSDRKKPGVAFWATVVVVVAVLYVLSIGPALLINEKITGHGGRFTQACDVFYAPLRVVYYHGPQKLRDALDWYGHLWVG